MTNSEFPPLLSEKDLAQLILVRVFKSRSGAGDSAVPRGLLGRSDWYIVTYDLEGRVAHFDLVQSSFFGVSGGLTGREFRVIPR